MIKHKKKSIVKYETKNKSNFRSIRNKSKICMHFLKLKAGQNML